MSATDPFGIPISDAELLAHEWPPSNAQDLAALDAWCDAEDELQELEMAAHERLLEALRASGECPW